MIDANTTVKIFLFIDKQGLLLTSLSDAYRQLRMSIFVEI